MPTVSPVSYTTVERIWLAFPPISSVTNLASAGTCQVAGDVQGEINGYIAKRYALPLTIESALLTALATNETVYRIVAQRQLIQFPPVQQGRHPLQQLHIDYLKTLEGIRDGEIELVGVDGEVVETNLSVLEVWSNTKEYRHTMDEGPVEEQSQDTQMLDDISTGTLT